MSDERVALPSDSELECSVGVMAYNEEANIAHALDSILRQELTSKQIREVIVVASGCQDRTADIVADIASREPRVRLIEQERREGKASAINVFIGEAKCPVLVMVGADLIVEGGAFDFLLRHFEDPAVGMVGGHPIPVNGRGTFLGHAVHLQWSLHDRIARHSPKLGEMVAFRNVVPSIPLDTAVDELSIQALITQLGFRLVYEPRAVVYNRGPATVQDFLRQRRRIYAGHLRIRDQQAYSAPTMSAWRAGRALLGSASFSTPQAVTWSIGTVGLEATARALGRYDIVRGRRSHHVWEMCDTTKQQIEDPANAHRQHNVAVYHIVNFHRLELEIGAHASRQLARRVADRIQQALGPAARVSAQEAGTAVALLPGDRAAAERAARAVVQLFEATPFALNGRGMSTQVTLACGIIAFPQSGPAPSGSTPAPQPELNPSAAT
ncbi:MAG TPA: glycosyltransferase [Streptosporangiaceae bacterium]|nr:glycosyltransferase [Streptosporangiaceae bacterium]